jgi:hypothetical protein
MQKEELIPLTRSDEAEIKREVEHLKYKYKLKRRSHVSMSKFEHNVDLHDTKSPHRISTAMTKSRVKFDLNEKSNCDYLTESPQGMSRLYQTRAQSSVHKIRLKRYREAVESLIDPNTSYVS